MWCGLEPVPPLQEVWLSFGLWTVQVASLGTSGERDEGGVWASGRPREILRSGGRMLIRPPASFSGARAPIVMMMTADLQSARLHAWLLRAWAWAWGGGEKPQIHRAPEWEGPLVYPLPIQRGTWKARSWEGRIDSVGGGEGGIDPGFEENHCCGFRGVHCRVTGTSQAAVQGGNSRRASGSSAGQWLRRERGKSRVAPCRRVSQEAGLSR